MNVFILVLLYLPLCWSADQYDLVFAGTCGSSGQSCQCPPSKLIPVRPNFFFITVDQQRKLRPDDGQAIHDFVNALPGRKAIRDKAVAFQQHYIAAAACSPSRATFYTGHYPSLHGVAQTDGVGKSNHDSEIHWLGEGVVPTLADYMVAAGYNVQYRGKWHVSHRDISIPGTETSILTVDTNTNKPIPAAELIYQQANLLAAYGFQGWIGNEPHGSSPVNTGMIRDPIYQQQVLDAIQMLESATDETRPFWLTASFVNPHDISVWPGLNTFQAIMADNTSVPMPPWPVSHNESTDLTKPKCQASVNKVWDLEIKTGPYQHWLNYSQSYYYFQNWVDKAIHTVFLRMKQSRFYNNTYTIFTADHGEMLLAHGGMRQKWAQAYEEAVHVEFMVHHPTLVAFNTSTDLFTSHIDIIPTVLGLAGFNCYNREIIRISLGQWHTEARALLGQDLSDIIRSNGQSGVPTVCWNTTASIAEEQNIPVSLPNAVYFMTDDDITRGDNQRAANITPALSPNAVEMVITKYTNGKRYKYVMIHDHTVIPTTTANSPQLIEAVQLKGNQIETNFEFYCLDDDPYELNNLIFSYNCTTIPDTVTSQACTYMDNLLLKQRRIKRLVPTFQNVDACPVLICGSLS